MDLWGSCRVGDSERVKFLLSNEHVDFDPNEADNTGRTPLILAGWFDHACCVVLLLADPRVDPSRTGRLAHTGYSALIAAVEGKAARAMELLLNDPRVDPNEGDARNGLPLLIASGCNFAIGVTLLLQHPRINPNQTLDGLNALCMASGGKSVDAMRVLLLDERIEIGQAIMPAASNMVEAFGRISSASTAEDHPTHCLVLLLASRRVDPLRLAADIATMRMWMPTRREARSTSPMTPFQLMARMLLPVLEAHARGDFRWCAYCHKLTPDVDLNRCGGCNQVGYCDEAPPGQQKPCHVLHWKAGHKAECVRFQAEATEMEDIALRHDGKGQNTKKKPRGGRGGKKGRRR